MPFNPAQKAWHDAYREKNRERINAQKRKHYRENKTRLTAYQKQYAVAHPDYKKNTALQCKYGIKSEVYEAMVNKQIGLCAICGKPETALLRGKVRRLCVDHCHSRNKIRELLCQSCNRGLGCFKDDNSIIQKALDYIAKHSSN